MAAIEMEQMVTEDLNATIRRWLSLFSEHSTSAELPDWSDLMLNLQQQGWKELPDHHAELLAVMTQESIEFTRFAGQLIEKQEQLEVLSFYQDFQKHINRLSDDMILKRWLLPEQLGGLLKTRFWDSSTGIELPWLKILDAFTSAMPNNTPFFQQSSAREITQLLTLHQQALQEYAQHYSSINTQAIQHLSTAIEESEQQIASLRELHRLWVDAYELCYAERIATQEYQLSHGRITNTFMQLKLWFQEHRNRYLSQLGIASEASLNLAFEKIHSLTKQVRHLEKQHQETLKLSNEFERIKQQLAESKELKP